MANHPDEPPGRGPEGLPDEARLTPELLEWARRLSTDEEVLAELREMRTNGSLELKDFLGELEQLVARR
jgi:hypothetical protein